MLCIHCESYKRDTSRKLDTLSNNINHYHVFKFGETSSTNSYIRNMIIYFIYNKVLLNYTVLLSNNSSTVTTDMPTISILTSGKYLNWYVYKDILNIHTCGPINNRLFGSSIFKQRDYRTNSKLCL